MKRGHNGTVLSSTNKIVNELLRDKLVQKLRGPRLFNRNVATMTREELREASLRLDLCMRDHRCRQKSVEHEIKKLKSAVEGSL